MTIKEFEAAVSAKIQDNSTTNPNWVCDTHAYNMLNNEFLAAIDQDKLEAAGYTCSISTVGSTASLTIPVVSLDLTPASPYCNPFYLTQREVALIKIYVKKKRNPCGDNPTFVPSEIKFETLLTVSEDYQEEDITSCLITMANEFYGQQSELDAGRILKTLNAIRLLYSHGLSIEEAKMAVAACSGPYYLPTDLTHLTHYSEVTSGEALRDAALLAAERASMSPKVKENTDLSTYLEERICLFKHPLPSTVVEEPSGFPDGFVCVVPYRKTVQHIIDESNGLPDDAYRVSAIKNMVRQLWEHNKFDSERIINLKSFFDHAKGKSGVYIQVGSAVRHGEFDHAEELEGILEAGAVVFVDPAKDGSK